MIDFQSGYILRPVNPIFIYFSLLCALLLNLLPIGNYSWVPDWLIICIVFWNIHQHRYVGVITAFILGLLMDVHNSDLLGLHAFSYTLVAYLAISWHRRIVALTAPTQALHVLPMFLLVSLCPVLAHWILSGEIYWWALTGTVQSVIEALLWPLATRVLLSPQRRPIDVDHNRPL
ncbi:rod shape-determining protein [Polynucleobacter sp. TUM22923]|jgi:rod shape-determining protein MreD|uniref:rod shape-determining protein MreD n=1 Tax=Polynucleobacter sp. TUM22923 TaxID=3022126 RepID=UPI0025744789|nr:rod shape-determining protein MreD [Polynucleobacter sp. TUM22923]BDX22442.1 rod shape-determining protein [Polynucleobacter sp. TUM22923]